MSHNFQFIETTSTNAVFECDKCLARIGFALPGNGDPQAVDNGDGTYSTPDNPDRWIDPCLSE